MKKDGISAKVSAGGGAIRRHASYSNIISKQNLFAAYREFVKGKIQKLDVLVFEKHKEFNLLRLHELLRARTWKHGQYKRFEICDPKKRVIHKALVQDRVLHHAVHRVLYPIVNKTFIYDSFSSRTNKGALACLERFEYFARKISRNNTRTLWVLKCDIKKFFDSVDHELLLHRCKVFADTETYILLEKIVRSYSTTKGKGIPLGNLTSQLFSNVYLDSFDHYVKRTLRVGAYLRYADDFFILETSKEYLEEMLVHTRKFLKEKLQLELHESKIYFNKWHKGVDVLGYISYPHYRVLRTTTKRRMLRAVASQTSTTDKLINMQSLASYKGRLAHCRGKGIKYKLDSLYKSGKV